VISVSNVSFSAPGKDEFAAPENAGQISEGGVCAEDYEKTCLLVRAVAIALLECNGNSAAASVAYR
jgi:hypothetical protein